MEIHRLLLFVIGVLSLLVTRTQPRPSPHADGAAGILISCFDMDCDMDTGPVCGIDASGFPRTFENRCFADLAYCHEGRYYAVVKDGEC